MPPLDEISLNRLESCDGCDGRGVEFYGYTRLRQPNDTSTGHVDRTRSGRVRRAVCQECRMSSSQYRVYTLGGARINTLGGVRVNIGIIRMSSGQYRVYTLGGVTDCFSRDGNLLNDVSSVCSKRFREQVNQWQSQEERSTYSMVFG
jgi:hypothetical protein